MCVSVVRWRFDFGRSIADWSRRPDCQLYLHFKAQFAAVLFRLFPMALLRASRRSLACFPQALAIAVVALVFFAIGSLAAALPSIRGVAPQDVAYFSGSEVRCRDGSRSIAVQRVNDDFCDCADGTDEPGTSACALSRFYCANRGHMPLTLFSSRVNDGICDCCDGSDEYATGAGCNNTCVQMGAETRTQLAAEVATVREGVKLRGKAVVGHVALREKWEREVTDLEERRAQLVEQEKALKARKEELERQEGRERAWRARLEREQRARDALVAHSRPKRIAAALDGGGSSAGEGGESGGGGEEQVAAGAEELWTGGHGANGADGGDGGASAVEGAGSEEKAQGDEGAAGGEGEGGSEDLSGLSKEEMGRRIASRWTGGGEGGQQHEEHSGHAAEHSGHAAEQGVADEGLAPPDVGYGDPDAVQSGDDDLDHDDDHDYSGSDDDEYKEDVNNEDEDYSKDGEEDVDVDGDAESEGEEEAADLEQGMGAGGGGADEGTGGARGDGGGAEEEDGEEGEVSAEELKQLEEFNPDDPPAVTPVSVWLARTLHWPMAVCSRLYSLAAPTPPLTLNASRVEAAREEHRGVEEQLRKARSRAKVLKDKLKRDYGPHGEFSNLVDRCFSFNANQYTYEICPYKKAVQKEGHSETTLGHFKRFEEGHTVMAFEDGEHCWNGPARSIKVAFKCGAEVAVLAVDEPNRCEYAATMTTPSVCTEEKAKELEQQLEAMLHDIQPTHDEL
ncbi:unnamed protein product [Closterium sp. Yama58-4]|nr:unnamed protein product [Closterium sp. Yama58-4]